MGEALKVELLVHLEATGSEPAFAWWAESPDIEGLSVAADHLHELLAQATEAVRAIVAQQGADIEHVELSPLLCAAEDRPADDMASTRQAPPAGDAVRQVVVAATVA